MYSAAPSQPRRVRCAVVETSPQPQEQDTWDLLPWADPYIASLAAALERELEEQNRQQDCQQNRRRGCASVR